MRIIPFRRQRLEAECSICGPCPEADREAMRLLIDEIPQNKPVCDDCLLALWERLFAGELAPRWAKRPRVVPFAQTRSRRNARERAWQRFGSTAMWTSVECRERAEQKLKQAESDSRHRRRFIDAAQAWLLLASGTRGLEATFECQKTCLNLSRETSDFDMRRLDR
jgi:hypothetical protein